MALGISRRASRDGVPDRQTTRSELTADDRSSCRRLRAGDGAPWPRMARRCAARRRRRWCARSSKKDFRSTIRDRQNRRERHCMPPPDHDARAFCACLCQRWAGFLMRDRQGRLASELAYLYGEDPAMARLLGTGSASRRKPRDATSGRRVYASRTISRLKTADAARPHRNTPPVAGSSDRNPAQIDELPFQPVAAREMTADFVGRQQVMQFHAGIAA